MKLSNILNNKIKLKNNVLIFDPIILPSCENELKFVCIAGKNGSGKTALFEHIKCLLKNNLDDASIFISHNDVNGILFLNKIIDKIERNYSEYHRCTSHNDSPMVALYDAKKTIDDQDIPSDSMGPEQIISNLIRIKNQSNDNIKLQIDSKKFDDINSLYSENERDYLTQLSKILSSIFKKEVNFSNENNQWFDKKYTFEKISSGEQQVLLLSLKIFVELFYKYYHTNKDLKDHKFYIFIDEIEAYLHPDWQYRIISILKGIIEMFTKKYLLIFTTHSTNIIDYILTSNKINDSSVVILKKDEKNKNIIHNKVYSKNDLPIGGIGEINHIIFDEPTPEYFILLYEHILSLNEFEKNNNKNKYAALDGELKQLNGAIEIIEIDPKYRNGQYNGKQTYITRMRHIIAHGLRDEHNYKWYLKQKITNNPGCKNLENTKVFYDKWEDKEKRRELLNSGIEELKKLESSYKLQDANKKSKA